MSDPKDPHPLRLVGEDEDDASDVADEADASDEKEFAHVFIVYADGQSVWGGVSEVHRAERIFENGDVMPVIFDREPGMDVEELCERNYFENVKDHICVATNAKKADRWPVSTKELLSSMGPGRTDRSGRTSLDRTLEWLEAEGCIVCVENESGDEAWLITRRGIPSHHEWRGGD